MYANTPGAQALVEKAMQYGVRGEGEVVDYTYHERVDYTEVWTLSHLARMGGKITRVRILADRYAGRTLCDISYIHATVNGKIVPVSIGVENCINKRDLKGELIAWAKREGVYAKGLGLLDEGNWSIQYN